MRNFVIVMAAIAMGSEVANADSIMDLYSNKLYWKSFDWDNADKSSIWIDPGFKAMKSTQTEDGDVFHHVQKVSVDGHNYSLTLITKTRVLKNQEYTNVALLDKQLTCDVEYNRLIKTFGQPTVGDGR